MVRMHMPAGTNQDPGAKFRRTTYEAFLCDAQDAGAIQHFPKKKRYGRWVAVVIVGLIVIALAGCSTEAAPHASKDNGAARACEGMTAVWSDSSTVECFKEIK